MSQMTMGRCLPGQYLIRYSVTNSLGLTSSAFLTILIEELNVVTLDYSFVLSNRSDDLTYVSSYASQLKEPNSSLASTLANRDLPAFGITFKSLRSLSVNQTSVGSLTDVGNGKMGYPISIKLTVVTVSRACNCLYPITPPSDPCNLLYAGHDSSTRAASVSHGRHDINEEEPSSSGHLQGLSLLPRSLPAVNLEQ